METRRAMEYMANGGKVPGKGRGDKVPAMLEPGEIVMPRDTVGKVGAGNLMATIRATHRPLARKAPRPALAAPNAVPGYRDGGIVEDIPPRSVTVRPNFTIPGMEPPVSPMAALPAPQPGTAVVPSTAPNFTRPGIDSPIPSPAVDPNVQDVRAKWNPANASPEAKAFMAGQNAAPAAESVMAQAPAAAKASILDADVGAAAARAGGAISRLAAPALATAGRLAVPVAIGAQAVQTANTSTDDYANRIGANAGDSFAGDLGARAVGTLQDIGNAATFGLADRVGNAIAGNGFGHSTAYGDSAPAAAKLAAPPTGIPAGSSTAGAGRGTVNPPELGADTRPDLAGGPALSNAVGSNAGTDVAGAAGVRKFTTPDGRTLYSNVAGTADNDKLMSAHPGAQVIPSFGGGAGGAQAALASNPTLDAQLAAARSAAADRGDFQAVSDSYGGNFAGGQYAPKTAQQLLAQQIQNDVAGGKKITPHGAAAIAAAQNADTQATSARTAQQTLALQTAEAEPKIALGQQQVEAGKRLVDIQKQYAAATDPVARRQLYEQMIAMQGHIRSLSERYTVLHGEQYTDTEGHVLRRPDQVLNNQTGQFVQAPSQTPAPNYETGKVYQDAKGNKAKWDGAKFVPA